MFHKEDTRRRSSFFDNVQKDDQDGSISGSSRGTMSSKSSSAPRKSLFRQAKELLNRKSYLKSIEKGLNHYPGDMRPSESDAGSVASFVSDRSISKVVTSKMPLPLVSMYSPQVWAFLGRYDELRGAITADKSLLYAKFDWLQDNKRIDPDTPPPHVPDLVRNALVDGLECQRVNLEQRYLLQKLFSGSTLLHYACAGNQYMIVKCLLDAGADPLQFNNGGKEAEFYTSDDSILKLLWSPPADDDMPPPNLIKLNQPQAQGKETAQVPMRPLTRAPPPPPPPPLPTARKPPPPPPLPPPPVADDNASVASSEAAKPKRPSFKRRSSLLNVAKQMQSPIRPPPPPPPPPRSSTIEDVSENTSVDEHFPQPAKPRKSVQFNPDEDSSYDPNAQPLSKEKKSAIKINAERLQRSGVQNSFINRINSLTYMTDSLQEMAMEDIGTRASPVVGDGKKSLRLEVVARKALRDSNVKDVPTTARPTRRQSIVKTNEEVEATTLDVLAAIPKPSRKAPVRMSFIKRDSFEPPVDNSSYDEGIAMEHLYSHHNAIRESYRPFSNVNTDVEIKKDRRGSAVSVFGEILQDEKNKDHRRGSLEDTEKVARITRRGSFFQLYDSMASIIQASSIPQIKSQSSETDMTVSDSSSDESEMESVSALLEEQQLDDKQLNQDTNKTVQSYEPWYQRLDRQVPNHRVKSRDRFIRSKSVDAVTAQSQRSYVITNRDMIWRRAAGAMVISRTRGDIEQTKEEAVEDGIRILLKEFKDYADIEVWEGLHPPKPTPKKKKKSRDRLH